MIVLKPDSTPTITIGASTGGVLLIATPTTPVPARMTATPVIAIPGPPGEPGGGPGGSGIIFADEPPEDPEPGTVWVDTNNPISSDTFTGPPGPQGIPGPHGPYSMPGEWQAGIEYDVDDITLRNNCFYRLTEPDPARGLRLQASIVYTHTQNYAAGQLSIPMPSSLAPAVRNGDKVVAFTFFHISAVGQTIACAQMTRIRSAAQTVPLSSINSGVEVWHLDVPDKDLLPTITFTHTAPQLPQAGRIVWVVVRGAAPGVLASGLEVVGPRTISGVANADTRAIRTGSTALAQGETLTLAATHVFHKDGLPSDLRDFQVLRNGTTINDDTRGRLYPGATTLTELESNSTHSMACVSATNVRTATTPVSHVRHVVDGTLSTGGSVTVDTVSSVTIQFTPVALVEHFDLTKWEPAYYQPGVGEPAPLLEASFGHVGSGVLHLELDRAYRGTFRRGEACSFGLVIVYLKRPTDGKRHWASLEVSNDPNTSVKSLWGSYIRTDVDALNPNSPPPADYVAPNTLYSKADLPAQPGTSGTVMFEWDPARGEWFTTRATGACSLRTYVPYGFTSAVPSWDALNAFPIEFVTHEYSIAQGTAIAALTAINRLPAALREELRRKRVLLSLMTGTERSPGTAGYITPTGLYTIRNRIAFVNQEGTISGGNGGGAITLHELFHAIDFTYMTDRETLTINGVTEPVTQITNHSEYIAIHERTRGITQDPPLSEKYKADGNGSQGDPQIEFFAQVAAVYWLPKVPGNSTNPADYDQLKSEFLPQSDPEVWDDMVDLLTQLGMAEG